MHAPPRWTLDRFARRSMGSPMVASVRTVQICSMLHAGAVQRGSLDCAGNAATPRAAHSPAAPGTDRTAGVQKSNISPTTSPPSGKSMSVATASCPSYSAALHASEPPTDSMAYAAPTRSWYSGMSTCALTGDDDDTAA